MLQLIERRERPSLSSRRCEDKRGEVPGHSVRVGRLIDRPDWLGAECSCGETVEARVYELAVAWVAYHKANVCCPAAVQPDALAS